MSHPRFHDVRLPMPVVVACFLAASAASAVAQAPGTDPTKLLDQLKSLEETVSKARSGNNMAAVDAITEATTSDAKAIALWIDSVRETEFRDKDKKDADFRAWRDGAGKRLSDPGAAGALRLHLQYLLLTIRASNATTEADRAELFTPLLAYLDDLAAADKEVLRNRQALDTSVLGSPIAKRYKLDITLQPPDGWSVAPGSFDAIYETTILPYLRLKKDVNRLQLAWSRRMQQQAAQVATQNSEYLTRVHREFVVPALEWGQAKDLYDAGSKAAAGKMLTIIQQNQSHKQAPQWIRELRGLLSTSAAEEKATTTPPEAPQDTTEPATPAVGSPAAGTPPKPGAAAPSFPPNLKR